MNDNSDSAVILPPGLDSGDLVLFNRRCLSMSPYGALICGLSKLFSKSRWDHVGLIVRKENGNLFLLEANLSGVKLRPLEERLKRSHSHEIAIRRLSIVRTEAFRQKLLDFVNHTINLPYETSTSSLLSTIIDPVDKQERERLHALLLEKKTQLNEIDLELKEGALTAFQRRSLQAERARVTGNLEALEARLNQIMKDKSPFEGKEDLNRVFCSELVAAAYQHLGLLDKYPPAGGYAPKDFSSEQTNPAALLLLKGAYLSDEIFVRGNEETNKKPYPVMQSYTDLPPPPDSRLLIRDVLKRSPIDSMIVDEYRRSHFISSFRSKVVEAGEVIFHQGDYGDAFYIVESGRLDRFVSKDGGDSVLVSTIGPGTAFGLYGLMYNTTRAATIRAKERCLLWRMDRPTYERFAVDFANSKTLKTYIERRKLQRYVRHHFLFRHLDRVSSQELASFFNVKFMPGEVIFEQGQPGDNFYIIKSGEVERLIKHPEDEKENVVGTLRPGQSFGELSLMFDSPRGSTTRAKTEVECWAISAENFQRLHLGSGANYLHRIFVQYASVELNKTRYMTTDDLMRFAQVHRLDPKERDRLTFLLLALVTNNRRRDWDKSYKSSLRRANSSMTNGPNSYSYEGMSLVENRNILIDFWEFVRFDILINQPDVELEAAFRLVDRNNNGSIGLDEYQDFISRYSQFDPDAMKLVEEKHGILRKLFGRNGNHVVGFEEFSNVAYEILPQSLVEDIRKLSQYILQESTTTSKDTWDEQSSVEFVKEKFLKLSSLGSFPQFSWKESIFIDPIHFIAATVASGLSRTVVAPLERLKILMQLQRVPSYTNEESFIRSFSKCCSKMFVEDGVRGMFRGNGANVARVIPVTLIQLSSLTALTKWYNMLKKNKEEEHDTAPSPWETLLLAGTAGSIATVVVYPLDLMHTLLSIQNRRYHPYNGIYNGIHKIYHSQGIRGLYRGLWPSIFGVFPYVGLSFVVYETCRPWLPSQNDDYGRPLKSATIVMGGIASFAGQVVSYPMDTCRRYIQVECSSRSSYSVWNVLRSLYQQGGIRRFYRGFLPNSLKILPGAAVSFFAYEYCRSFVSEISKIHNIVSRSGKTGVG
ncbi:hypothetical protein GpartN1_g1971.t1 [Galdieria partita]|uniref:Mitochondrial carrier protein n=1 Tax=Galdieria partita TaxID=83374 RepID=A0A9C7UP60_9RHOD|nr:hypothetical protein GpartN1_g1971.t1 [Galdieria partita]